MELYDEQVEQKKSKVPMIIGICIAILVILTLLVVLGIIYIKNSITTIEIDGERHDEVEEILYIENIEGKLELYIPIIKISQYLGYEGFSGDYENKSEDKTKCHVISKNETAVFTLDSNVLIKITEDTGYEYVDIDEPVFEKDGELYTTIDGIQKAFNVVFACDEEFKDIKIYSMDFLVQYYTTNLKIEKYATNFLDKKAILEDMIIIQKDGKYGVIKVKSATTSETILETKYELINYLPTTDQFLVKSNGKYGIVNGDAEIKVKIVYDSIKIMDNQNGLYLVKQNNTYGIVNTEGATIIETEYNQIGINIAKYAENGVESSYILLDTLIPIKNIENKWGFFNIEGKQITDFKYTDVGCQSTPATNSYPALIIPSHKVIVVQKDKYYNLISLDGEELIPVDVDSVYFKEDTETGQSKFFLTSNDNTKVINVDEWLTSIGR